MRRSPDRKELLIAAGYLAAIALCIYATPPDVASAVAALVYAAVLLVHVLAGWGIGRWWALLLPVAAVLIAIPAGTPAVGFEPLPVWFGVALIVAPPGLLLISLAVIARKGGRRLRGRKAGAH